MRIIKQSKVPAFLAVCGFFFAGLFLGTSILLAGQEPAAVTSYHHGTNSKASGVATQPGAVKAAESSVQSQIDAIVNRVSNFYQVDPKLIHAMIRVESDYDPTAISPKGAMGLMQLIPSTAQRFGVQDPFNLRENIQGGVSYLKYLLGLFGGNLPLSLAAYNAGEETVIKSGGIPEIPETENYVREVTYLYHSGNTRPSTATPAAGHLTPIVRYVDSKGVIHFTNAE